MQHGCTRIPSRGVAVPAMQGPSMSMCGTGARVCTESRRRKDGARNRKCAIAPNNCHGGYTKHAGHACFDEACLATRACLAIVAAVAVVEFRGRHGVRSMKGRVQGPALSAAQAENVLEAIRSAAEVNSGLDAHAWTNAEMIRVREVFASAAGMKRFQVRVQERDAADERLREWMACQTQGVCASGSL